MGTPDFAGPALSALVQHYPVAAVYCQPARKQGRGMQFAKPAIASLAESLNLPTQSPVRFDEAALADMKALAADVLVVVAYGMILPAPLLEIPRLAAINAHASLLPRWRGAAPIQRAIAAGDSETGVTLMRITHKLDAGPIYMQQALAIEGDDTGGSLHDKLADLAANMLVEALPKIVDGSLPATAQDDSIASYAPKISEGDTELNFAQPTQHILNHIRAFAPQPGAWLMDLNPPPRKLVILAAAPAKTQGKAGTYLGVGETGGPVFATSDGGVEITRLKPAGKGEMTGQAYLNGNPPPQVRL